MTTGGFTTTAARPGDATLNRNQAQSVINKLCLQKDFYLLASLHLDVVNADSTAAAAIALALASSKARI